MIRKLPTVHRRRPRDATGWFWAFVCLLAGLFYSQIFPVVGIALLVASPFSFIWQFKKWHSDWSVVRKSTVWCQKHYPTNGNFPVVDFVVAFVHDTGADLDQLQPSAALDDFNWMREDDDDTAWGTEFSHRHQVWLDGIIRDARICNVDLSTFTGDTLHDAVSAVTSQPK